MEQVATTRPMNREIRLLIGALVAFLVTLIVALFAITVSIIRMNAFSATADDVSRGISPLVLSARPDDLKLRLQLLGAANGISRIEIYRGDVLLASTGETLPSAEVLTRPVPGGRAVLFFDASTWIGGRRSALIISALAMLATMAGLLVFIVYLPKFMRPIETMLNEAQRLGNDPGGDHDARYLVHTFRDAVERIQKQSQEIDHLRDAATSRSPDLRDLADALSRSFSSGFVAVDASGHIVGINDAGRTILGLTDTAETEDLPPAFAALVRSSLDAREAMTRREVLIEQSESLLGVTTVPLFDGEAFLGLFALFTDLTTFRAMEGRLRDLENLVGLGQMSAGIAHEFRNSLFTILGYLKLALRSMPEEPATKIRSAEAEAQKLAGAVDALLSFASPLKIRSQRVRVDELASSLAERFASTTSDIAFPIERNGSIEINGDRELLDRAIENIYRNAIDAVRQRHPNGGGVIETTIASTPNATITIRDNGVGIGPEEAAAYLLPFQSGKPHGFGLGLPLARKIILHHGGTLTLSGEKGEGAIVKIEFFA